MGKYFNPPTQEGLLEKGGRELETDNTIAYLFEEDYKKYTAQLHEDEILIGLYIRPFEGFNNAVWFFEWDEMLQFEEQVRDGIILRKGFYTLPKKSF